MLAHPVYFDLLQTLSLRPLLSLGSKLCSVLNDYGPLVFTLRQRPIVLWIAEIWHYLIHQTRPLGPMSHVCINRLESRHDTDQSSPPAMCLCQLPSIQVV